MDSERGEVSQFVAPAVARTDRSAQAYQRLTDCMAAVPGAVDCMSVSNCSNARVFALAAISPRETFIAVEVLIRRAIYV